MEIEYVTVADAAEIPVGAYKCVMAGGRSILVACLADRYAAVENRCSHAGNAFAGPILKGVQIACPKHGARFDLRTGEAKSAPAYRAITTFPVRVTDGRVEVGMPKRP